MADNTTRRAERPELRGQRSLLRNSPTSWGTIPGRMRLRTQRPIWRSISKNELLGTLDLSDDQDPEAVIHPCRSPRAFMDGRGHDRAPLARLSGRFSRSGPNPCPANWILPISTPNCMQPSKPGLDDQPALAGEMPGRSR